MTAIHGADAALTIGEIVQEFLKIGDPDCIPEFTLDGDIYLNIVGVTPHPDGGVTLEVAPW